MRGRPTPFGTLRLVGRRVAAVDYDDALPVENLDFPEGGEAPAQEPPREKSFERREGGRPRGGGRGMRRRPDRMPIKYQLEDLFVGQQIEGVVVGSLSSAGGGGTLVAYRLWCYLAYHALGLTT